MVAEILIGFGLVLQLAAWLTQSFMNWATYVRLSLTFLNFGVYVWALLMWMQSYDTPSKHNNFRSWRINQLNFWVVIGTTVVNIVLSMVAPYLPAGTFVYYFPWVAGYVAALSIAIGIILGWRMLNLWWTYDPEGSMLDEEFDYFVWTDEVEEEAEEEVEAAEEEPAEEETADDDFF